MAKQHIGFITQKHADVQMSLGAAFGLTILLFIIFNNCGLYAARRLGEGARITVKSTFLKDHRNDAFIISGIYYMG